MQVEDCRGGVCVVLIEHLFLELEHLRKVEFIDRGPGRPGQTVSAYVKTGRQDHRLPYAGITGSQEELIEVLGPCAEVAREQLYVGRLCGFRVLE
ncbi:Uncharacterised protein [Mycobacteroides abscessus subsp. bolletii]|nr:Uncharacterised protein [Mycobacteroides abscessus subsp. bolletii]